jgi:hypothetical protein
MISAEYVPPSTAFCPRCSTIIELIEAMTDNDGEAVGFLGEPCRCALNLLEVRGILWSCTKPEDFLDQKAPRPHSSNSPQLAKR